MLPAITSSVKCVELQKEKKKHRTPVSPPLTQFRNPLEKFPMANRILSNTLIDPVRSIRWRRVQGGHFIQEIQDPVRTVPHVTWRLPAPKIRGIQLNTSNGVDGRKQWALCAFGLVPSYLNGTDGWKRIKPETTKRGGTVIIHSVQQSRL